MSAENALSLGDNCYSKGQFDEAIKWYTQAANEGYVEGMEKLLKTCVEQGRNDDNMVNKKGIHYWGMASSTLRGIMTHTEISQDVKDRSYVYYDEIMYGLALAYMWETKYKEAERAWEKVKRQETVAIKILKANCDYHGCLSVCRELASSVLENMNLSPEEKAKKILPIPTSWTMDLDEFADDVHKQILSERPCAFELPVVMMALFDFILFFYVGIVQNMALAEPDKDKAYKCWKIFKGIDLTGKAPLPDVIEQDFQKRLKEETSAVIKPAPQPTPSLKTVQEPPIEKKKVDYDSISRRITISRPKKMEGWMSKVQVYVDGVEKATIKNGESTVIVVDGREHQLCCVLPSSAGVKNCEEYIPAGSKNFAFDIDMKAKQLIRMKALQFEAPELFEYALKFWVKFCASWNNWGVYIMVSAYTQGPKKGTVEMSIGGESRWRLCVAEDIPEAHSYIYGNQGSGYMTKGFTFYEPDCYLFGCPQDAFEEYDVRGNAPNAYLKSYKTFTDNIHIEINFTEPDDDYEMYYKFVECCKTYCYSCE